MFIKLNILKNGSCAEIIVIAEEHEEEFKTDSFLTRRIIIWHNHKTPSLQVRIPRENYDNDLFVIFKSEVPFKDFREASHIPQLQNRCVILILFYFLCFGVKTQLSSLFGFDQEIQPSNTSYLPSILDGIYFALVMFSFGKLHWTIGHEHCGVKTTRLSQAMNDFLDTITDEKIQEKLNTKKCAHPPSLGPYARSALTLISR